MAGHIYNPQEEKITKSRTGAGTVSLAYAQTDFTLQSRGRRSRDLEIGGHQTESPPADNSTALYNSRIMNTYIELLERFYPAVDIDAILRKSEITRHEAEDPGHWFTQHQSDRFHENVIAATGNPGIAREAGRFTVSSERVGAAKQYALGAISLSAIYMKTGKLAEAMSRGAVMTPRKLGPNKVEIVSRPTPGTVEKPHQCENRIGTLEGVAKLVTKKFAEVEHPACIHQGDDCCRYILTWDKTAALIWKRISSLMPLAGLLIWIISVPFISRQDAIALGLSVAFLCLTIFLYAAHLEKKDLVKTIESQGNAA
jgi:predicted hydrocarbon binding protein